MSHFYESSKTKIITVHLIKDICEIKSANPRLFRHQWSLAVIGGHLRTNDDVFSSSKSFPDHHCLREYHTYITKACIGFPIQIITPRHQRKETRDSLFMVFKQPQTRCKHNVVTELVAA